MSIPDWLTFRQDNDGIFPVNISNLSNEISEILQGYVPNQDPNKEITNQKHLCGLLRAWQRDIEYLSSLNLHKVIAKHVRIACRKAKTLETIENWVGLDYESAAMNEIAAEIANAIRSAWKVQKTFEDTTAPSKFAELSFHSIRNFQLGLEELIGYPPTHIEFLSSMKREHEQGVLFPGRGGKLVDPKNEWNIVMKRDQWKIDRAGCVPTEINGRDCSMPLDFYINLAKNKFAKAALTDAEVAALRLWTGPMHLKYAEVLRNPQKSDCPYVTTLHAINSGITKLARIWPIPESRKVYRGYRNQILKDLKQDEFNCVGGVEKCVLATSTDFNVAVNYSNEGAFVLDSWKSMSGSPQIHFVEGRGAILVYRVCVSSNVKSKTLEEFVMLRKDLHINLVDILTQETERMICVLESGSLHGLIKRLGSECRQECDHIKRQAKRADVQVFNEGTLMYVALVESAVMLKKRSLEIIDLATEWFNSGKANAAAVALLQSWQLEALRAAFKSSECPNVSTLVLEQACYVENIFGAERLKVGAIYKVDTVCSVAKLLSLNPKLMSLEMEVSSASSEVWEKVFNELCHQRPSLQVNGFRPAEYFISTLKHLELRNLSCQKAAMIAPALLQFPPTVLTSLNLNCTPIACTGAESLGRALTGLQRLKELDLRSCQIADRGCTGIAQNLSSLCELEELKLTRNNVGDNGFNILTSTICAHGLTRLKSVDMRFNDTDLPSYQCGPHCIVKNHIISMISAISKNFCVEWNPGGDQIASASDDGTIIIWDAKSVDQISTLNGHPAGVTCVSWHPGGDQIATASRDQTIIIWDAKTGKQISTLIGHSREVTSVAWSPGGDQIASGSRDDCAMIWDAKSGEQVLTLKQHCHTVTATSVAWHPMGNQIVSISDDNSIHIWNAKTGEQISRLQSSKVSPSWVKAVGSVAWSPGGDQIASASGDRTIIVWDAKTGQDSILDGHTNRVTSVAWHPGGDQIASASVDRTIIIWDPKTGNQLLTLKGHSWEVTSVAWRPGGDQIASGSCDKTIIIWDSKTGKHVSTLKWLASYATSVAWRPGSDQIALASHLDKTIMILDVTTGELISTLKGDTLGFRGVAWRPGGDQIASASLDNSIIIWDAKTGDKVWMVKGNTKEVTSVDWSPVGDQIVSGCFGNGGNSGDTGEIFIWDAETGNQVLNLKVHTGGVSCVAWSPGGDQIASGSNNKTIAIWDMKSGEEPLILVGHTERVTSVAWRPWGSQIASGSDDNIIIIWDTKTGDQVSTLKGHTDWVRGVAWKPDGTQIASASDDRTVIIWNAKTGGQASKLKGHTAVVMCVAWGPVGDQIVSGSCRTEHWSSKNNPGEIIIWDVKTGDQPLSLNAHTSAVKCVAWRPGGDQIASGSVDRTIIIWDVKTCEQVSTLQGHNGWVTCVAWSPGGDQIASGSSDKCIIIWDAKTGDKVLTLKGHTREVTSVAWSPGGDQIVSGATGKPGKVFIWSTNTGDIVSELKGHTNVVASVAWHPGRDQIVSGGFGSNAYGSPGEVIIWDSQTGEKILELKGHTLDVTSVAWSPGGDRIASGSRDEKIIIWDVKTGEHVFGTVLMHKGQTGGVQSVAWHPGGNQIASASCDQSIHIWDVKTCEQISTLEGHSSAVMSVVWSPCGDQIASGSEDKTIIVWDARMATKFGC